MSARYSGHCKSYVSAVAKFVERSEGGVEHVNRRFAGIARSAMVIAYR